MQLKVTLPDGSEHRVAEGTLVANVLQSQGGGAIPDRSIVAAKVNGRLVDLSRPLQEDSYVEPVSLDSQEGLEVLRHSSAHLMAQAVKTLYPEVQVTIGPAIEDGFYYDFKRGAPFTPSDLDKIETIMQDLAKDDLPYERLEVRREEAIEIFRKMGEEYKVEILEGIEEERVSLYRQGNFLDLCRGPHLPSTGAIRAFRLTGVAGAYWRGNERNEMLQRIYGTAFPTKEELKAHLALLEEAKRRDHRVLGKELDLFSVSQDVGPGLVLWHPKGARVRHVIETFWKEEHYRAGYELVYSPHLAKIGLWELSGHTDFYRENMYSPMDVEGQDYLVKPMNCPFHVQIYKSHLRSYKDLPLRWAELGTVYRYERSGVLHGLLRVRGFTQDDAHIFCRPEQLEDEVANVIDFTLYILRTFGFQEYQIFLSTRPQKFVGTLENWEAATSALARAVEGKGLRYTVDLGQGVFYGPKVDIKIRDSLKRSWQCSTIQVDFNLPERFDLNFTGPRVGLERPIMIHRALMGSIERFLGCLIEHYAGAFPLWLSPVQVQILTISDRHETYAREVETLLKQNGLRTRLDLRTEKLGYKIRSAEKEQVPYVVVLGDRELETRKVSPRAKKKGVLKPMDPEEFMQMVLNEQRQQMGGAS
jgi:threonyl-tRNA synthetase